MNRGGNSGGESFWNRHSSQWWVPILVALLGGLGYLYKDLQAQKRSSATLIVRVTGCAGISTVSLNGSEEHEGVSPGTSMARLEDVKIGPNSLQITCEGLLPWYDEIDIKGGTIQEVAADLTEQEPIGAPSDSGDLSVTATSIVVNRTCDTGSARANAELRWVISLSDQKFASPGITRISPSKPFPLENVTLATNEDRITVVVEMWEYDDSNRAVGSTDRQQAVIQRDSFSEEDLLSREIQMWPELERNECDVRVLLNARKT